MTEFRPSRALATTDRVARVGLMAHPISANTTAIEQVRGGCSPEGWGGLEVTHIWFDEAHLIEGFGGLR